MDFLQYCFIFFATMFAVGMVRIFMEALDGVPISIIGVLGTLICTFIMNEGSSKEDREAKIEQDKIPVLYSKTNDGCSVYKFVANGNSKFFTRCTNSDTITTNQTESCGKNCTRDVSITVESSK